MDGVNGAFANEMYLVNYEKPERTSMQLCQVHQSHNVCEIQHHDI